MKKLRFTVGDWVQFTYEVAMITRDNVRRALAMRTPMSTPRIGQVVGYRMRREGTVKRWGGYDYEMPNEFQPTKTVYVWQVAVSVRGPVVEVFEEHMTPLAVDQIPPDGLPPNVSLWNEEVKQEMREDAQRAPRDSRGRFTRCTAVGNEETAK